MDGLEIGGEDAGAGVVAGMVVAVDDMVAVAAVTVVVVVATSRVATTADGVAADTAIPATIRGVVAAAVVEEGTEVGMVDTIVVAVMDQGAARAAITLVEGAVVVVADDGPPIFSLTTSKFPFDYLFDEGLFPRALHGNDVCGLQ